MTSQAQFMGIEAISTFYPLFSEIENIKFNRRKYGGGGESNDGMEVGLHGWDK